MERSQRVYVNELLTADSSYSVFKRKGSSSWEVMKVGMSFDPEAALEAYEAAPVLKVLTPEQVPSEIKDLLREVISDAERFDKLIGDGREFVYVEDADGDTSYNFILHKVGEYYKYLMED